MPKPSSTAGLLERVREVCLALPEAGVEAFGRHSTFTVRRKKFAYFLDDHHGDGMTALCVKIEPEERQMWMKGDPERFYLPAYIGHQGWMGCRLDLGENDWQQIREFVIDSYCIQAPKKLAAEFISSQEG